MICPVRSPLERTGRGIVATGADESAGGGWAARVMVWPGCVPRWVPGVLALCRDVLRILSRLADSEGLGLGLGSFGRYAASWSAVRPHSGALLSLWPPLPD